MSECYAFTKNYFCHFGQTKRKILVKSINTFRMSKALNTKSGSGLNPCFSGIYSLSWALEEIQEKKTSS